MDQQGDHDAGDHTSADGEAEHNRGLVLVDLRLVQVDQVEDRDEERRDEDGCGDQTRDVEDEHAGQADDERPAKLMDLVVAEVRKQGRDDGRLGHVLGGMRGVAVLARPGVAELVGRALMGPAARAEDAVRDVVRAVITPHKRGKDRGPRWAFSPI